VPEAESWYVQAGQGMLATINMAGEKNGYTMTDRGTYIKYEHTAQGNPQLKILVEGDDFLKNQYSVMAVNPNRCENVNYEAAVQFSDWITGEKAQNMIGAFKLLDKTLFIPNAR
jgi:tungstate transport system substrate-binding protein